MIQAKLALSGWLNAGTTQSILRKYSSQSATGIFQRPYEVFYSTGIKSEETKDNAYLNDFVTISDIAKEKIVGSINESGAVNSEMAVQDNIEKLVDNPKSLTGTEYREKEFKQILRRLKPLNNKALKVFTDMLEDEKTTEATKVKVAVFIMKTYQDMMDDLYKPVNASGSSDIDDQEDKPLAPIISFKVAEG